MAKLASENRSSGRKPKAEPDQPSLISICICTFKRPEMLDRLLACLCRRSTLTEKTEIIVVDNDRGESARNVVEAYANSAVPVWYQVEPQQNIALARNRALSASRGDWIALIDDDETPVEDWLNHLMSCARSLSADAVFGPVLAVFSPECPRWLIDGSFFDRPRFPTGTPVPKGGARSGNVLFRRDMISDVAGPFDPAFGLSGGSDGLLFERLRLDGKLYYWCDEAIVSESVPPQRASWRWVLKRAFRGGQTYGRMVLIDFGRGRASASTRLHLLFRSALNLCAALAFCLITLPLGRKRWFRWLCSAATQIGKASAFASWVYLEYADQN